MSNGNGGPQHVFRAPQIPFDIKCLVLASVGVLVLGVLNELLGAWFDAPNPIGQMVGLLGAEIGQIAFLGEGFLRGMTGVWDSAATVAGAEGAYGLQWYQAVLTGLAFFGVWAVFGGALLRTVSLRLTRDEPISFREALTFGGKNITTSLLAPVLVVALAAFFALCNAAAGAVASIYGLGSSILILVLFPLVLISSLLIILTLLGGIFGLPLMWAGISIERNGALEALSRAFSYIFARPLQFFFGYLLLFVLMSIVILVGTFFEGTTKETFRFFAWRGFQDVVADHAPAEPGMEAALSDRYRRKAAGIAELDNIKEAEWYDWLGFAWMWLLLNAVLVAFKGYAVHVFLGGTGSLYLQLRREVDGTDESEIFLEEEEAAPESPPPPEPPAEPELEVEPAVAADPGEAPPSEEAAGPGGEEETAGGESAPDTEEEPKQEE
ncbi:MAG: hypothetical protein ACE5JG_04690 [Planctomycetota bacterium]